MTDVTGFGLAGHPLGMCRGSGVAAEIRFADLPLIEATAVHARSGVATGASDRNWASYGHEVALPAAFERWPRDLLTDPQTSGALLVACVPEAVSEVLAEFRRGGFERAGVVGRLRADAPRLLVRA